MLPSLLSPSALLSLSVLPEFLSPFVIFLRGLRPCRTPSRALEDESSRRIHGQFVRVQMIRLPRNVKFSSVQDNAPVVASVLDCSHVTLPFSLTKPRYIFHFS